MRLLGLSPARVFSGFETSFFDAIEAQGPAIERISLEIPWFRLWCTLTSFAPDRKRWGTRRDRHYHTTISAFKIKSAAALYHVEARQQEIDAIYQVGALWNPLGRSSPVPLILHVDYTSLLSKRRGGEWRRREGREQDFWFEQEQRLYREAAVVLTTTENARSSIIFDYGIDPDHVVTVGAGVSPPYDRPEPNRLPAYDSKRILFVGKGYHGKGLDTVLEAFPLIRAAVPEARLTIIGPTDLTIDQPGVDYLGRIADRNRVRDIYYDHALFVMPSRNEPLGQVFLEAMSCQLPCIGSTLDAMPEMIDHDRTGFVVDPGNAEKLATHAIEVISQPGLALRFGRAGFATLQERYTWPVVGAKIVREIDRCLARVQVQPR